MGFSAFRQPEYLYQTDTNLFIFRMKVPSGLPTFSQQA